MGIGLGEFVVILLVAFIIVGPEDLPKVARTVAKWVKTCKRSMKEISSTLELDAEKKEWNAVGQEISGDIHGVRSEWERVQKQVLESAKKNPERKGRKSESRCVMRLGTTEILLILVIALVVFGTSRLSGVGKALGTSIREFKEEMRSPDHAEGGDGDAENAATK